MSNYQLTPLTMPKKVLSKDDLIELLSMLPVYDTKTVAKKFNISIQYVRLLRTRYKNGFEEISVDYEKQQTCTHSRLYFHCHDCKLSLSEKDPLKIIEHVQKHIDTYSIKNLFEMKL